VRNEKLACAILTPMPTYVALLRAVNLAGRNMVGMADLREMCDGLGCLDTRSLLQSGNLVFRVAGTSAKLETALQAEAKKRLGLDTEFFVRAAKEWESIVAANPFPREAKDDPGHLIAMFLKDEPDKKSAAALREAIVGRERFEIVGRQAYIVYPDGVGRSKLTTALIEKKLGTRGTGRNWNTVLKLRTALESS
jgi:uncharacterized protein (DUF1697 family)